MTHFRPRFTEAPLKKALSWTPSISLLGMRQTGKTTLLKRLATQYMTFDDDALLGRFEREGDALLGSGPFPLALDEVQKSPKLFDRLKIAIDSRKTPGRYILSGSIRFSSKRTISESLTGRTATFELYPLSIAETLEKPFGGFLEACLERGSEPERLLAALERRSWLLETQLKRYLECGGLPGIAFRREPANRARLFEQHLDTLLGRDLQFLTQTQASQRTLRELLARITSAQGQSANYSAWARELRLSAPTVRKLVDAMEGLFLIRRHGKSYFVEDQGLVSFMESLGAPVSGYGRYLGAAYHQLRCELASARSPGAIEAFSTRGGAEVPFVVLQTKSPPLALTLDPQEIVSNRSLKSLAAFARRRSGAKAPIPVALHLGSRGYLSSSGVACVPLRWIF